MSGARARPTTEIITLEGHMAEKKVACDCGKTVRASNDDQLVADVQKHAKEVHNMNLTRDQVLAMAQPA